jgi:hypothetical protein
MLLDIGASATRENFSALRRSKMLKFLRQSYNGNLPANWIGISLLAILMLLAGTAAKSVLASQGSLAFGALVMAGFVAGAILLQGTALVARGAYYAGAAILFTCMFAPPFFVPNPDNWLRSVGLTDYSIVLLSFYGVRGARGWQLALIGLLLCLPLVLTALLIGQ